MAEKHISTTIRLVNAWVTGAVFMAGVTIHLDSDVQLTITSCKKNPDGDGYLVSGFLEIDGNVNYVGYQKSV